MFGILVRHATLLFRAGLCAAALTLSLPTHSMAQERVPAPLVERVNVAEYRNIRFYSDDLHSLTDLAEDRIRDVRRAHPGSPLKGKVEHIHYLSLSGGGGEGA